MDQQSDNSGRGNATVLLQAICGGDRQAAADLLPLVYGELRKLAAARMANLPPGNTLQPTALVHEAYLKLVDNPDSSWEGRRHFFGAAAQAMRDVIVDHARSKGSQKRGGQRRRVALDDQTPATSHDATFGFPDDEIIAVDSVLDRLVAEHPRQGEVVMLRYFAGLTEEQAANVLGVTVRTAARDWRFARAWLREQLAGDSGASAQGDVSQM